ncbi:uncharacterized protein At5g65660-like [Impatiens glandulifera]|uniref:uncharacterized protein At5g65660-like n=1 Tax=Impatiens glandulifera TaxID=253017 RepID=UPI001FB15061|nr:uncharacterized protein At5g65660-like [Impatiens glandulifera]
MENSYNAAAVRDHNESSISDVDASRPSLGFPLGTALLLIVIFSLSGIFSCCYHWDKIQSLRRSLNSNSDDHHDLEADDVNNPSSPSKPTPPSFLSNKIEIQSLPVIMPGDRLPKFIALPCPCQPPRPPAKKIFLQPIKPVKPPPIAIPFY